MNILQKELWIVMPFARQYGRALVGDTERSDQLLAQATSSILKRTPCIAWVARSSILFPLLLIEFHKRVDTQADSRRTFIRADAIQDSFSDSEMLYELVDEAVQDLPEIQRRIYLLVSVSQLQFSVVSRIVSEPIDRVTTLFEVAHAAVTEHLNAKAPRAA